MLVLVGGGGLAVRVDGEGELLEAVAPPTDLDELLDALAAATSELDDLLFDELGAHTVGCSIPTGVAHNLATMNWCSTWGMWATRLREKADALAALAASHPSNPDQEPALLEPHLSQRVERGPRRRAPYHAPG